MRRGPGGCAARPTGERSRRSEESFISSSAAGAQGADGRVPNTVKKVQQKSGGLGPIEKKGNDAVSRSRESDKGQARKLT